MYSATPTDLMEQQRLDRFRRAHLVSIATSKVWRVRPRAMVVNGGRLMMIVDTAPDQSVVCARITGMGTLVVEGAAEQDLTPMDLAYSPRSIWPDQKDIPAEMLATMEAEDKARRDERRRKARKPKASKRLKG